MTYNLNYYSVILSFSQQHRIDITYTLKYSSNFKSFFQTSLETWLLAFYINIYYN